ncbi:NAD(P)H-hydrate dehydratase [Pseudophaeobacter profundi]|uniref:NAD(P)H-hydrate dehydratase n=1 Tax=Pseudophaeobacter profundi TaxID=3034152 RepID=UPI00242F39AC|nr:NAD(P)H-hydrate dehydratase [Pseudophaeobacter profundi]
MAELLTAAQMRSIEQAAIEAAEVTGLELMERAGQGVVAAIFETWPELDLQDTGVGAGRDLEEHRKKEGGAAPDPADPPRGILGKMKAVVLCGPGNNGGDGFVVARLLRRCGWEVEVFLLGQPDRLPADAKTNYERWVACEKVKPFPEYRAGEEATDPERRGQADLVIDALFGTGLVRSVGAGISRSLSVLQRRLSVGHARWVGVDMPSGLCADSGKLLLEEGDDLWSDYALTVTFHRKKIGHLLARGPECCGPVKVADIGLDAMGARAGDGLAFGETSLRGADPRGAICRTVDQPHRDCLAKGKRGHKYSHGHALVLSGGHGKTGAARLAARGALRMGAGLVTLGSPRSAMFENAAQLTAIMLHQIDGAYGITELLEDQRFNALCLGPGLGRGMDTQAVVIAALKAQRATVLDADALTRFERNPQVLFDLLHAGCVMTPHGGEFAKLFPDLAEKLAAPTLIGPAYSKVDATRAAAARAGCVVLYKGADTVIADPEGRCSVHSAQDERAAPWLATAGAGDVLAGFITGLMARGVGPMLAAEAAAWLHVDCALEFGPGLISEDLPEALPSVLRRLTSSQNQ